MKELSELFTLLPEIIETYESADMFKKTEEGRKIQETHFRNSVRALQMENANGWNCACCIQFPKDKAEEMLYKGFITSPLTAAQNNENAFESSAILAIETDLEELLVEEES